MKSPPPRPTAAQRRILQNVADGLSPGAHLRGRAEHGGFSASIATCRQRDWLTLKDELTEAGWKALHTVTYKRTLVDWKRAVCSCGWQGGPWAVPANAAKEGELHFREATKGAVKAAEETT